MNLLFSSDIANLLFKTNVERERRPSVVILECFNCRWEDGEVGKVAKVGGW